MEAINQIIYYISSSGDNPVKEFLDSLQKSQKAKVFRIFQIYQLYGISSIIPHTKKLTGTPLWEIRVKGKDNIRIIYNSLHYLYFKLGKELSEVLDIEII